MVSYKWFLSMGIFMFTLSVFMLGVFIFNGKLLPSIFWIFLLALNSHNLYTIIRDRKSYLEVEKFFKENRTEIEGTEND